MVDPRHQEGAISRYSAITGAWTLRQPGIQAVRLFRDLGMSNKFFVQTCWATEADMLAAAGSEEYARIIAEVREDWIERMSVFALDVIDDDDERPLLPADPSHVTSRILKVTVRPGAQDEMIAEYQRSSDGHLRQQPGCLRVQLLRNRHVRNVFLVQSYWEDERAMRAALSDLGFDTDRGEPPSYLEERIVQWEMRIVADDANRPVFEPVPAAS